MYQEIYSFPLYNLLDAILVAPIQHVLPKSFAGILSYPVDFRVFNIFNFLDIRGGAQDESIWISHCHLYVSPLGDSAGGNLAAAVAQRMRDDKFTPTLKMQILLYPALQAIDFRLPSYINDECPLLPADLMVSFWLWYALGDDEAKDQVQANDHTPAHIKRKYANIIDRSLLPKDMTDGHSDASMHDGDPDLWDKLGPILQDPYFSPGVASDLRNLPRTFPPNTERSPNVPWRL